MARKLRRPFPFFRAKKVQDILTPENVHEGLHCLLNGTIPSNSHVLLENIPASLNKTSFLVLTYFCYPKEVLTKS